MQWVVALFVASAYFLSCDKQVTRFALLQSLQSNVAHALPNWKSHTLISYFNVFHIF